MIKKNMLKSTTHSEAEGFGGIFLTDCFIYAYFFGSSRVKKYEDNFTTIIPLTLLIHIYLYFLISYRGMMWGHLWGMMWGWWGMVGAFGLGSWLPAPCGSGAVVATISAIRGTRASGALSRAEVALCRLFSAFLGTERVVLIPKRYLFFYTVKPLVIKTLSHTLKGSILASSFGWSGTKPIKLNDTVGYGRNSMTVLLDTPPYH